jgi:phosphoribosylformylglycinamidine synthase subunit PurL
MSKVTVETAKKLGLLPEEYRKIKAILGRNPNFVELSIFSVMWSEHCSYKNSITELKKLPRKSSRLLVEAGEENAGLVDIGGGMACAFKIESHNHPSAIEPFQGAATGVGGIHRDIFTMGARPIAALNSLRFGDINNSHTRHLMRGVVHGIGSYGNSFGVPTVGGEVYFNPCYNQNILVNAMSIGIVKVGETVSACADGPGNPVFIVGSATGKDGIHGATFASADLTENSVQDLPAVQVGDPFQEKLLLEATLEAIATGAIVGMQDMGAAGITCSTSEMSAKSKTGMRIDLSKVPTRQANMLPWEILLSESQERMLIVVHKGREQELLAVFEKWDLECAEIGVVTDTGRLEYYQNGKLVADVPADDLVLGGGAPIYKRKTAKPAYLKEVAAFKIGEIDVPTDLVATAKALFNSPNLVSKRWVFEQYDSMVRLGSMNTVVPSSAAVIRLKGTNKALVATVDCNATYVYADPYQGAMIAVAEAARNIVCSGGLPVAITNCLNFGNPYNPEVYWQFVNALRGMGDACIAFETPVTGGNVSFYNHTVLGSIAEPVHPTPTIGMLGLMDDVNLLTTMPFKAKNDRIFLVGKAYNDIASSEYLRVIHEVTKSPAPRFKLTEELVLQRAIRAGIEQGLLASTHDVSEGGLFATLMEKAVASGMGFKVRSQKSIRTDAWLFGESQSRVVVTVPAEKEAMFMLLMKTLKQSVRKIGTVGGNNLLVDNLDFGKVADWKTHHEGHLAGMMD